MPRQLRTKVKQLALGITHFETERRTPFTTDAVERFEETEVSAEPVPVIRDKLWSPLPAATHYRYLVREIPHLFRCGAAF
jgi:hypothetical protein